MTFEPVLDRDSKSGSWMKRGRKSKAAPAAIVFLFLISAVSLAVDMTAPDDGESRPARTSYIPHNPIIIFGNFSQKASEEGWSGDGSESAPYIIEGYDINAVMSEIGIGIGDTEEHFVIKDCLIYGANLISSMSGVHLYNVTNGTLTNNTIIYNGNYGVRLMFSCSNITILENNCSNNGAYGIFIEGSSSDNLVSSNLCSSNAQAGIYLDGADNNTIFNNTCSLSSTAGVGIIRSDNCSAIENTCIDSGYGIGLGFSNWTYVTGNTCLNNSKGITIEYPSRNVMIDDNNCSNNTQHGIYLYNSGENLLSNNTCLGNTQHGIYLNGCFSDMLSNNSCAENGGTGIRISSGSNFAINGNDCSDNQYGMYLQGITTCGIRNNTCSDNSVGMTLFSSSCNNSIMNSTVSSNSDRGIMLSASCNDNRFFGNNISGSGWYGFYIFDAASNNNSIWDNSFYLNNPGNPQAYDAGTNNTWNTTGIPHGHGNWWSDLASPDSVAPFGIVDWSYNLTGSAGAKDYWPLTTYPYTPYIPEFSGILVPIIGLMLLALVFGRMRKKRELP